MKIYGRLIGQPNGRLSNGQSDHADVLGRLIDDYALKEYPHMARVHLPLELLRFLIAEHFKLDTGLFF